jgi:hypothetical protein
MPLEEIVALLRARPFEPFRIQVDDGASYEVRHPEQVIPLARSLIVAVGAHPDQGYCDRADRVALVHVTRLEPLAPTGTSGQN